MRIRSIKPEWLDDERLLAAGSDARVLSVALILLADDHGNGRGSDVFLASRVFPGDPDAPGKIRESLAKLRGWFASQYVADGQTYFTIHKWNKHQRVDKPGKNRVPPPVPGNIPETPGNFRESLAPEGKGREGKGVEGNGGASAQQAAPVNGHVGAADASRAWHGAAQARAWTVVHSVRHWRADYATIAAGANATETPDAALWAVCAWFWLAPSGPVAAGRVKRPEPRHLAKRVSTDLDAAYEWARSPDGREAVQSARGVMRPAVEPDEVEAAQ